MNRKTLTLLLLISCFIAKAQYKGGMELGGNLMQADFIFDEPIETTNSWGIRLGYVAEFEVTDHFYLRGALLINQRGFQFAGERWGLNAIDLPINIGYSTNLGHKNIRLFIDGGFNMEYNTRAFTKIDGELVVLEIGSSNDDIKTYSNGVNFGTGLQLSEKIKIRMSYYLGLTNLVRTPNDEWKNRVLGLSLNYFF